MRAVVQRVQYAKLSVKGKCVAEIGRGLLAFVGIGRDDDEQDLQYMAKKLYGIRVFPDGEKETALSLQEINGELLLVSQFTLYGDVKKGRRPSFSHAMAPEKAKIMFEKLFKTIQAEGCRIQQGLFGAMMHIELLNEGPYTVLIDSKKLF